MTESAPEQVPGGNEQAETIKAVTLLKTLYHLIADLPMQRQNEILNGTISLSMNERGRWGEVPLEKIEGMFRQYAQDEDQDEAMQFIHWALIDRVKYLNPETYKDILGKVGL